MTYTFFILEWTDMLDPQQKKQLLYDLFASYEVMKRGKSNKHTVIAFDINKEKEILQLYDELLHERYQISPYTCFLIYDPVPREIFAPHIRDRIIHHFIYTQLNPILEGLFLDNSYACRIGKGNHHAIHQVKKMLRAVGDNYTQEAWVAKYDISGYFMSIDKTILSSLVKTILEDNQSRIPYPFAWLRNIIQTIIINDPTLHYHRISYSKKRNSFPRSKSLFASKAGTGLPLGNLTSQIFANIYLHELDIFVVQNLGIRQYGRYMDDFVLMHTDKSYLQNCIIQIERFLHERLHLQLHPNKRYFQPIRHGVTFCGVQIYPYYMFPRKRTIGRRKKKMYEWKSHPPDSYKEWELFRSTCNSYLGMLKHRSTYRLRIQMLSLLPVYRQNHIRYKHPFDKIILKIKKVKRKFKKTLYIFYKLFGW
ncbi:MAG: reverse transcriptase/maturase family protein [Candidatus Absconditabacterales bacterium]